MPSADPRWLTGTIAAPPAATMAYCTPAPTPRSTMPACGARSIGRAPRAERVVRAQREGPDQRAGARRDAERNGPRGEAGGPAVAAHRVARVRERRVARPSAGGAPDPLADEQAPR